MAVMKFPTTTDRPSSWPKPVSSYGNHLDMV